MYETDCRGCIFNSSVNNTYVDCTQGVYNRFVELGHVKDINTITRLCTKCRNTDWAKLYFYNIKGELYSELTNVYTLVIIDEQDDDKVIERLEVSLKNPQTIKPKQILVAYSGGTSSLEEVTKYLKNYCEPLNILYSVTQVFGQEYKRHIIDMCCRNVKGMFYLVQINGLELDKDCLKRVYQYLEVLLNKVLLIKPLSFGFGNIDESIHGLVVSILAHKKFDGNRFEFLENKIMCATKEENINPLVKTWPEIYHEILEFEEKDGKNNSLNC